MMKYNERLALSSQEALEAFDRLVAEQSGRVGKTLRGTESAPHTTTLYTTSRISLHGLLERLNFTGALHRKSLHHGKGLESLISLVKSAYPRIHPNAIEKIFSEITQDQKAFKTDKLETLKQKLDEQERENYQIQLQAEATAKRVMQTSRERIPSKPERSESQKIGTPQSKTEAKEEPERVQTPEQKLKEMNSAREVFMSRHPHNSAKKIEFLKKNVDGVFEVPFYDNFGLCAMDKLARALNNTKNKEDAGERAIAIYALAQAGSNNYLHNGFSTRLDTAPMVAPWDEYTPHGKPNRFWTYTASPGFSNPELQGHFNKFIKELEAADAHDYFGEFFMKLCKKYPTEAKAAATMAGVVDLVNKTIDAKQVAGVKKDLHNHIYMPLIYYIKSGECSPFISEFMWQIANHAQGIEMPTDLNS